MSEARGDPSCAISSGAILKLPAQFKKVGGIRRVGGAKLNQAVVRRGCERNAVLVQFSLIAPEKALSEALVEQER